MSLRTTTLRALERHGIDGRQLLALLAVYLKQDLRGGKTFTQFRTKEYVSSNKALLIVVGSYVFMGLALAMAAFTRVDVFSYSALLLTITLFIVALAILAESGNVLFNETEADVIGHLPIASRTHFAAKILNLLSFTVLLAAAANLFPMITGIWTTGSSGLFVVAHAVSAMLVSMFATGLSVVSYGLLMRYVNKERFDNIVAYGQVVLVLFFVFGYQLFPRVLGTDFLATAPGFRWYFLLYPPAWFSGVAMLLMGKVDAGYLALAGLAVASLIILGTVAMRKIATGYSSFVSKLAYGPDKAARQQGERPRTADAVRREGGILRFVRARLLRRPVERAVFDLVLVYVRRNREIKVRLYPSLAYFIVFPLIAVFTKELADPFTGSGSIFYPLMGAAMIPFVGLTAIEGLIFSEHYHAAYIFHVVPIARLADVHRGFGKAILLAVAAPGFGVLIALYSIMWQNPIHAVLVLLPWMMVTPVLLLMPFLFRQMLPLSRKYQKGQQSARNITLMIACFAGLSILGVAQGIGLGGGAMRYWVFLVVMAILSLLAFMLLSRLGGSRPLAQADDLAASFGGEAFDRAE